MEESTARELSFNPLRAHEEWKVEEVVGAQATQARVQALADDGWEIMSILIAASFPVQGALANQMAVGVVYSIAAKRETFKGAD